MSAGRSHLTALIKYFWDNHWKNMNVMLILCGSVASFMIKRVLSSKALYGRITLEIHLTALLPNESYALFRQKKSDEEILKYLLVFGGIPRYLEEIDLIYKRMDDVISVCEIKHHREPLPTSIIPQMKRKLDLLEIPRGYSVETVLISLHGPDKALLDSEYFNDHLTVKDILRWS